MLILRSLILGILLLYPNCVTSGSEQTYFIKATEDSPCAAQPCLTLSEFVHNTTKDVKASMILQFGAGNHTLGSRWSTTNIEKCSMSSKNNDSIIVCSKLAAGFTFEDVSKVTLINLTFIGCGSDSRSNAILQISQVICANISMCKFLHSKGTVIEVANASITTNNCSYEKSSAGEITAQYKTVFDNNTVSNYTINTRSAVRAAALLFITESIANFINSRFSENFIETTIIHTKRSTLTLRQCELSHNSGENLSLLRSYTSTIVIINSNLTHNLGFGWMLLLVISSTNLSINSSILAHNVGQRRGTILSIKNSLVESHGTLTITNNKHTPYYSRYGALEVKSSKAKFGIVHFSDNMGSMWFSHSKLTFTKLIFQQARTHAYILRRAIISIASIIRFQGMINHYKHYVSIVKSAVYAIESRIYATGDTLISNNKAKGLGGALYLDQSDFICEKNCTFIGNTASKGGAIYAINSIITIGSDWDKYKQNKNNEKSLISFVSNSADEGGAIYLEGNSKLRTPREITCTYELEFENNTAQLGGSIFVNDYTSTCENSTCFIQAPIVYRNDWIKINSTDGNTTIYGGLLDRCIAKRKYTNSESMIGSNYFSRVTKGVSIKSIATSAPVRVCFCQGGRVDCNYTYPIINVKRGETFNVTVAAVDQVNHTLTGASIFIKATQAYVYRLGIEQRVQKAYSGCNNLTLNVFSPNNSIELILYASGPCQDIGISKLKVKIKFKYCTCPIGFQALATKDDCSCDCDQKIKIIKTCNQSSESLLRQGDFWINSINYTDTIHYLIYPHCPYDYCIPSIHSTYINLNTPNGADAQCALNRTGLLCSSCKPGLSLSLGSSLCLQCPRDWQKLFIAITLGAIASGIILILVILVLNLTTAVGTLNGLIFYANIVASNNTTYNHMSKPSVFSVFIAWLNLDLGIDTCFYNGLDSYSKAWFQLAFPVYLIAVLIMVIIMSKYSSRFAKLIGKQNPIATLATVILLSYMKLLRNIKDIFSVAVLKYPDGLQRRWLPDANIEYLQRKHIPLFLVATIIVCIGLIYTILLLTWQWLLKAPHYKCLGWIRNTRLNLFMEANLAPYSAKHRYWTGLLLLIRVALYLEIALDTTNRKSNNLLATGMICACLLFIKTLSRSSVYRNKLIDYLDSLYYMNLLILSIIYLNNTNGREIAAIVSVSISFVQLLCILTYHTMITLLEIPYLKTSIAQRLNKHSKLDKILPFVHFQETDIMINTVTTPTTPTSTEIGLKDSRDTSAAEITEHEVEQSLTTRWEESDSLREPLLQELKT